LYSSVDPTIDVESMGGWTEDECKNIKNDKFYYCKDGPKCGTGDWKGDSQCSCDWLPVWSTGSRVQPCKLGNKGVEVHWKGKDEDLFWGITIEECVKMDDFLHNFWNLKYFTDPVIK
jgi:hypothetical protein